MTKIARIAAIASLLAAAGTASAWWGGAPYGWNNGNDFFGDGFGDFNMSMSARGNTSNRFNGYGYGYPYYGPYGYAAPYGYGYPYPAPYAAPVAPQAPESK